MGAPVVVLAGGTGGAKLARGLLDVCGEDLVAIVNTGDDVEMYGAYVSPDPDLVTFWLADRIDERGWGLRDDTFHVMDGLRELGVEVWFNLGDRDLAIGLRRAELLAGGARLTEALAEMTRIVQERYPGDQWNIYAAQASDGDNYASDSLACLSLLNDAVLPVCQYFAYVEVYDSRQAEIFMSSLNVSDLWKDYQTVAAHRPNFAMKRVFSKADVFPVFHQLFAAARNAA